MESLVSPIYGPLSCPASPLLKKMEGAICVYFCVMTAETPTLYRWARILALVTIVYNLLEGAVSTALGYGDETLALFGFGVDSFIESISGLGVYQMVRRLERAGTSCSSGERSEFERSALNITGWSFYALALTLTVTAIVNIVQGAKPESTFWGVVVSSISIVTMSALVLAKRTVGTALSSSAILADANCTLVCIYMSVAVLLSSVIFEFTGFAYADAMGALALVWFSVSEGRECFAKAAGHACGCEAE